MKKKTFLDRIKDAVRAFCGKPSFSIDYGINVKKCSECDRGQDVFYLCDGTACNGGCSISGCTHTTDVRHAKNFKYIFDGEYFLEKENSDEKEN